MLNDINSNLASNLLNSSVSNKNITSVTNTLKNSYGKEVTSYADLIDEGKISKEALEKYQTEQEIKYYKQLLSQMLGSDEDDSSSQVNDLLNKIKTEKDSTSETSSNKSKDLLDLVNSDTRAKDLIEKVRSGEYQINDAELASAILSDSFASDLLG